MSFLRATFSRVGVRVFSIKPTNMGTGDFKQKDTASESAYFTNQDKENLLKLTKKLSEASKTPEVKKQEISKLSALLTQNGVKDPSPALLKALESWKAEH